MSAWVDTRDNIRDGIVDMWDSMPPLLRAFIIGVVLGAASGAIVVALWLF